jgi:hypothetical protein
MPDELKALLRHAVRRYLAERAAVALRVSVIRDMMEARQYVDFTITDDDVAAAIVFLKNLTPPQVMERVDSLGSLRAYQITSDGALAHERES